MEGRPQDDNIQEHAEPHGGGNHITRGRSSTDLSLTEFDPETTNVQGHYNRRGELVVGGKVKKQPQAL